jgi:hypothetical protein
LDAGDEGVTIGVALSAIIKGLEDDGFAAGVASAGDEGDLARFQDYHFSIREYGRSLGDVTFRHLELRSKV